MSSGKDKSKPSSHPKPPRKYNKKALIGLLIIAVPSTILLTPALHYGSFTLQVARIAFDERTVVGQSNPSYSGASARVQARGVYDYAYSIETGGIFRTVNTSVSTSQGTASITIKVTILTPSARTVDSGSVTVTGGIGERSHTIYMGPNEGVRDPGVYTATVTIAATVMPTNGPTQTGSATIPSTSLIFLVPIY